MRPLARPGAPPGTNESAAPEAEFRDGGGFLVRGVFSGKRQINITPPPPAPQVAIFASPRLVRSSFRGGRCE
jgi:hypothetical protein